MDLTLRLHVFATLLSYALNFDVSDPLIFYSVHLYLFVCFAHSCYDCICGKKTSIKSFVAPEGSCVWADKLPPRYVGQWLLCVVGNVGARLLKRQRNVWNKKTDISGSAVDFLKSCAYITHEAFFLDYAQLPPAATKGFVPLSKTCKHT